MGGELPIAGATVTLYASSSAGVTSASGVYAGTAQVLGTTTTDSSGTWGFSGVSSCPQNQIIYVASSGGDNGAGTNNIGPGLYGVLGRKPGTHPGFAYSPAMVAFGAKIGVWDYQHIFDFIAGPQKYIDGTKMTFIGMKDRQDRINVIAYLHTLGSSLPIPPPNPKAAAPAPGKAPPAGASNTNVGASNTATGGGSNTSAAGASNSAAAKPGK